MLIANEETRALVQEYIDTGLRIRNESRSLNMRVFVNECGTVCCWAGWMIFYRSGPVHTPYWYDNASSMAADFPLRLGFSEEYQYSRRGVLDTQRNVAWEALFGPRNGAAPLAVEKQLRKARWLLHRIDTYMEWERQSTLPKRERVDHLEAA